VRRAEVGKLRKWKGEKRLIGKRIKVKGKRIKEKG
jgi:hypothetical protein